MVVFDDEDDDDDGVAFGGALFGGANIFAAESCATLHS